MKTIRIINTIFFLMFLFFSYQMYQRYDAKNKKIEQENNKIKIDLENSFPVRQENFYVLQKDAPVRKKVVEPEPPKEEETPAIAQEGSLDLAQESAKKDFVEKVEATKAPVVKKEEIKKENKDVKKVENNVAAEKKVKKVEEKKVKKEEVAKAIVIEKKEKVAEKPAEAPKKSAPVVTEIKEVKLPKVSPGEIREIEGTFDPN